MFYRSSLKSPNCGHLGDRRYKISLASHILSKTKILPHSSRTRGGGGCRLLGSQWESELNFPNEIKTEGSFEKKWLLMSWHFSLMSQASRFPGLAAPRKIIRKNVSSLSSRFFFLPLKHVLLFQCHDLSAKRMTLQIWERMDGVLDNLKHCFTVKGCPNPT